MAQRHAQILAQIQNVRQLEAVVTAMRGIAAARAQHCRALLPGIDAYSDVISAAIGQALALLPQDGAPASTEPTRRGVVAFAAEQGFAGTFAERLLEAVAPDFAGSTVFLVGSRGLTLARERGLEPAWSATLPTHIEALPSLANHLAEALYDRIARGELAAVDLVFARAGSDLEIGRHSLLPLSYDLFARASAYAPPLTMLAPERLLQRLSEEYVFAQLYKAAMHAFEAENEARMRAMAAAKTNIATKLSDLTLQERQLRQEEITAEIIELAAGAEAALGSGRG
ncbi:MAG: F0F1 ATP synthase subunit gamma [Alphaproteobacteria bacterium]|nr:F0F1 ATP synthase subunit gamma [Alphaproteobacteria bacterium]MCB9930245.1 F0F1 ATP synthase subunit gamma [Alphaproteobacteria bacterium]